MRIVVNDIAASSGGAMTILKQFYQYVIDHDTENEWIFLLGDRYLEETENIKVLCFPEIKKSRYKKVIFDCFKGKKVIEKHEPDVVVSLQNIISFGVKVPQVVYVHQSIPFQKIKRFSFINTNERSLAVLQYFIGGIIKQSIKKADKVFVQTKWMQKAVIDKTNINLDKVIQVPPTVELGEPNFEKFNNNRFFYPTNTAIYKNVSVIIEACKLLNAMDIYDFEVRLTLPSNSIMHPNINCIGELNREQMIEEYQSGALLFPSYIETVGLPLLEARSCQTRIIASDTAFSRECLNEYNNVIFFDPFDAHELARIIKQCLSELFFCEQLKDDRNNTDSWDVIIREINKLIQ